MNSCAGSLRSCARGSSAIRFSLSLSSHLQMMLRRSRACWVNLTNLFQDPKFFLCRRERRRRCFVPARSGWPNSANSAVTASLRACTSSYMATDAAPEDDPAGTAVPRKLSEALAHLQTTFADRAVQLHEVIGVLQGRAYLLLLVLLA